MVVLTVLSAACQLPASAPSPAGTAGVSDQLEFCVSEINRYRALAARAPLSRAEALERYAAEAAQHDGSAGVPHQLFARTNGGGVARAETQLLRWHGYSVRDVIVQGLAEMWAAGPGGSHYAVMMGNYSEVGCGVFVNGRDVSVSQAYR